MLEGTHFKATTHKFKGYEWFYILEKEHSESHIVLSLVKLIQPSCKDKLYYRGQKTTIVERQWFNTDLTTRKIEKL